jgi:hypothetical protein
VFGLKKRKQEIRKLMMKKKLMPLALLFVSLSGVAAEFSVTKSSTPYPISGGARGHSMHKLMSPDYPTGQAMMNAHIKGISWNIASYPQSRGERAELCISRGGLSLDCEDIQPGSVGYLPKSEHWPYTAYILIRHKHESGPSVSRPSGVDSVTFHMSY